MTNYGVFSGRYFLLFGLNTERYGVSLRIQSKYGKIRTRKKSVFGQFSRIVTWSKQKTLGNSNLDISNFCLCWTNFPVPLAVFSCNPKVFSKFPKLFLQFFFTNYSLLTPASAIIAIMPARMSKNSQIKCF